MTTPDTIPFTTIERTDGAQPDDPAKVTLTDRETGETVAFEIHQDVDNEELVLEFTDEDGELIHIELDRSQLEGLSLSDPDGEQGDEIVLGSAGGWSMPGRTTLTGMSTETGIVYMGDHVNEEDGHNFTMEIEIPGQKVETSAQAGTIVAIIVAGVVITVVVGAAAGICFYGLKKSGDIKDCTNQCVRACGEGNVASCETKIGLDTSYESLKKLAWGCTQKCKAECQ
jgi:hypothetical protein